MLDEAHCDEFVPNFVYLLGGHRIRVVGRRHDQRGFLRNAKVERKPGAGLKFSRGLQKHVQLGDHSGCPPRTVQIKTRLHLYESASGPMPVESSSAGRRLHVQARQAKGSDRNVAPGMVPIRRTPELFRHSGGGRRDPDTVMEVRSGPRPLKKR